MATGLFVIYITIIVMGFTAPFLWHELDHHHLRSEASPFLTILYLVYSTLFLLPSVIFAEMPATIGVPRNLCMVVGLVCGAILYLWLGLHFYRRCLRRSAKGVKQ